MSDGLIFRCEDHSYWIDGRRLPAVSDIIRPLSNFAGIPPEVLERKRQLGTETHYACDLDDAHELDDANTAHEVLGYVEAWRAFKRDTGFTVVLKEHKLHHPTLWYGGTLDRLGDTRDGERLLLDIKTSVCMLPVVGVQIAGYHLLVESAFPLFIERMARKGLQLHPDGRYRLIPYDDPNDKACFLSLLNVLNWRALNGYRY